MTRNLLGDDASATSPGFDTLDPDAITGSTLKIDRDTHGFACIRTMLAPNVALEEDAWYDLKFKVATPWRNLPGSSNSAADGTGWLTMSFPPGGGPVDAQIIEIDKAGSTPGAWQVMG